MSDQNETWPEKLHLSDMHASEIVNWMQDFDTPEAGYADSRGHYTREDLYTAAIAERDALRAKVERLRDAVDADLSERMVAAGMVPLDAITKPDQLTQFSVHASMTDLDFFAVWLERKAKEYGRMKAAHQAGVRTMKDEIFEFVMGKAGAFSEVLDNFRAALGDSKP